MKKRRLKKPFRIALEIIKTATFGIIGLAIMMYAFFGAVIQTSERIESCGYGEICD